MCVNVGFYMLSFVYFVYGRSENVFWAENGFNFYDFPKIQITTTTSTAIIYEKRKRKKQKPTKTGFSLKLNGEGEREKSASQHKIVISFFNSGKSSTVINHHGGKHHQPSPTHRHPPRNK